MLNRTEFYPPSEGPGVCFPKGQHPCMRGCGGFTGLLRHFITLNDNIIIITSNMQTATGNLVKPTPTLPLKRDRLSRERNLKNLQPKKQSTI